MKSIDADPGLHRFRKTNLFYTKDPYLLFQDPTVLGFKLMFDFSGDGLLSEDERNPNTALNYLKRIGQADRYNLLKKFIYHLKAVNNKTPWFFQEVQGLADAWKRGFGEKEFTPLLPEDRNIKIVCLESVDLRITTLMDLYRKACFDWNYRREVVPWNLRHFNIMIYVYEIRDINRDGLPSVTNFKNLNSNIAQQQQNEILLGSDPIAMQTGNINSIVSKTIENISAEVLSGIKNTFNFNKDKSNGIESSNTINPNISRIMFNLKMCEFKPDDSSEFLTTIDNKAPSMSAQAIAFSYRNVEEFNLNTIYGGDIDLYDKLSRVLDSAAFDLVDSKGNPNSFGYDSGLNPLSRIINPLAQLGMSTIEQFERNLVGRALLGNVFGLQPANLINSIGNVVNGNPGEVIGGISEVFRQGKNTATSLGMGNNSKDVDYIGNAYK